MPETEEFKSDEFSMKDFSSFQVEKMPLGKRIKRVVYFMLVLALSGAGFYFAITKEDQLKQPSNDILAYKDGLSATYDTAVDWLVRPFYYAITYIIGLTFMYVPRKNIAIKIICLYSAVHLISKYLIIILKGQRLVFDDGIVSKSITTVPCTCSFGFPSSQAADSAFIISIMFYELLIHSKHGYSECKKFIFKIMAVFLMVVLNVAKFYMALHTIPQILSGTAVGLSVFFASLIIEDKLNRFFSCCYFGRQREMSVLIGVTVTIMVLNVVVWLFFLEDTVKNYTGKISLRCFKCFRHDLLEIRKNSTASLQYYLMFCGVILGIILLRPRPREVRMDRFSRNFSWHGLARILIMGLMYLPTLILYKQMTEQATAGQVLVIYSAVYMVVGISISFGFTLICRKLGLSMPGDVESRESPQTSFYRDSRDHADSIWHEDDK
jgi:hypothetical protein